MNNLDNEIKDSTVDLEGSYDTEVAHEGVAAARLTLPDYITGTVYRIRSYGVTPQSGAKIRLYNQYGVLLFSAYSVSGGLFIICSAGVSSYNPYKMRVTYGTRSKWIYNITSARTINVYL